MTETCVFVTIETESLFLIRLWTGNSVTSIRRAVRRKYGPDAYIQFGRAFYRNHYGAH